MKRLLQITPSAYSADKSVSSPSAYRVLFHVVCTLAAWAASIGLFSDIGVECSQATTLSRCGSPPQATQVSLKKENEKKLKAI